MGPNPKETSLPVCALGERTEDLQERRSGGGGGGGGGGQSTKEPANIYNKDNVANQTNDNVATKCLQHFVTFMGLFFFF